MREFQRKVKQYANGMIRLRSSLPGRERWDVDGLLRKSFLAEQIETELHKKIGVIEVKANPFTGRVLVVFDEHILTSNIGLYILEIIENIGKEPFQETLGKTIENPTIQSSTTALQEKSNAIWSLVSLVEAESKKRRKKAVFLSLLNNIVSLISPYSFGMFMAISISGGLPFFTKLGLSPLLQIVLFSGTFFGAKAIESITEYKSKVEWELYATDIEHALRIKVFSHVEYLDMAYLENQTTAQLMALIYDDSLRIQRFLEMVPNHSIQKLSTLILVSIFLLWISPISFLLGLIPIPIIYLLFRHFHKRISQQYQLHGQQKRSTQNHLMNSLYGLLTIKSFTTETYELQKFSISSLELQKRTNHAYSMNGYYTHLTSYMIIAGTSISLMYAGIMLLFGTLSVTTFLLLSMILPKLISIMGGLDQVYDRYHNAFFASQRLLTLLNIQPQIINGEYRLQPEAIRGELVFEKVSFRYPSGNDIFKEFDFHIPANSAIGMIGATGSGKSTIIKLLLRLYEINEGRILLDGIDISQINFYDLRNVIGLVNQDVFLFNGTVYENILYGRPDATREEVIEAAQVAEALDFILDLPDGFESNVGERGQKLSGGQRQRISIARVVLKDPPILILDEATSSVDNETEAAIQRSIDKISKGRTMIVIAHRMSTIRYLDRIHVIEDGQITEQGTHDELLDLDGFYASLWKLQTGEQLQLKSELNC